MMDVCSLGNNHMGVCGCCDELLVAKNVDVAEGMSQVHDLLNAHLAVHPECQEWYDALPTFEDIRGIAQNCTGGLPSEEFIRRLRDGEDIPVPTSSPCDKEEE